MRTSELTGIALDWAVAVAKGIPKEELKPPSWKGDNLFRWMRDDEGKLEDSYQTGPDLLFSVKWEAGGPIITKEKISVTVEHSGIWLAFINQNYANERRFVQSGPTPLIAAMRCYVAYKLGDKVNVPKEFL